MSATSAAPVASVLASNATATLPPARRSPMMPDPTTAASRSAEPVADRQPARLDASQLLHDASRRVHLDSDVIHRAVASGPSGRQRQVDRRPLGQELEVPGLRLDRRAAEEPLVEVPTLPQIRHV